MNILITGASNGIGEATLIEFLNHSHFCIALDIAKNENINKNLVSFVCDTRKKETLIEVENYLTQNSIKLDLIINIAGIHRMVSLVETDFEVIKKVIDVNLLGTMLVNNTFHKFLKEKGKIINLTSEVATYTPMPFNGIYNISKSALEVYSDSLRQELNILNQKVITIRPGSIETKLSRGSLEDTKELASSTTLFKKESSTFYTLVKKFFGKPLKREKLAKKIYKISLNNHPKLSYAIHRTPGLILLNLLPKRMQLWIIKFLLNLKNL